MPSIQRSLTSGAWGVHKHLVRSSSRCVGSLVAVDTQVSDVVVTYDDGPCPVGTIPVLEALAEHRATATFFVLLTRTRQYRSILDEVVAAGHEIGLHGSDHRRLADFGLNEIERRTRDGRMELEDVTGQKVRWFRPPYGKQTFRQFMRLGRCGLVPVSWSGDMADWRNLPQPERVKSALRVAAPGEILLGHDGFAGPFDGVNDGPAPTIDRGELARHVLDAYNDRGLHGRSLKAALEHGTEVRRAWFSK